MEGRKVQGEGEKANRHLAHKDLNGGLCKILNVKEKKIKYLPNVPHVIINYLMQNA